MENLLFLFNKISQINPLGVFNQEVVVVQNPGMQHWLNLAIAQERGISMNIRYALPSQFLWKLIRTLASDENVPDQSPYSREVLAWRIHRTLASSEVVDDEDFLLATQYWQGDLQESSTKHQQNQAQLKRYQLSTQLADLYEQYLIFRPDWLDAWQEKLLLQPHADFTGSNSSIDFKWQAKLWQILTRDLPYNPVALLNNAIDNIANKTHLLPKRLSFFGINTMPPIWLNFIHALSDHIDVHFFHLNPCFSYWGDILSEKQAIKQLSTWSNNAQDSQSFIGNPLLANLGQQGREFLSQLQEFSTFNIDAFSEILELEGDSVSQTVLQRVQHDILTLNDSRQKEAVKDSPQVDDSITITSCHSALREVQGLHDYLLHQFNQDETLTPKDILVMCPQIETYAPYVHAVFTHGWQDVDEKVPPLPCSIADRSAIDSDPLIASFMELLQLPDSRFQVSQLLGFLRSPAISQRFSISVESIDKISMWLTQSSIHWGMDHEHKKRLLGEKASKQFTWQQGLSRLLRGFAFADSQSIYQNQLLQDFIEGDDALLLGQLMLFVEQLQFMTSQLNQDRSASEWQTFLIEQMSLLFSNNEQDYAIENSLTIITKAINALVEYNEHAKFNEPLSLSIVTEFLSNHFSQGDASKQFMVGQVTFCSMLPMRSIPFKVIAILGLNDGDFPRQRQPLGFDLMACTKTRLGDRSRRGDDRYLFLEAIISARKSLYLSFQGKNIKNNSQKQPSLVLKELMEYLTLSFGWSFEEGGTMQLDKLRQLPMQAFSLKNYHGKLASFDKSWLSLAQCKASSFTNSKLLIAADEKKLTDKMLLNSNDLIRFFQHPAKAFAHEQLKLFFDQENKSVQDFEPFSIEPLQSYLLKQQLLGSALHSAEAQSYDETLKRASLSGIFPELPNTQDIFDDWWRDSEQFANNIISNGADNPERVNGLISLSVDLPSRGMCHIQLSTEFAIKDQKLVHYRSSTAKAKDLFGLYLQQLILQIWQSQQQLENLSEQQQRLSSIESSIGLYFNTKAQQIEQFTLQSIDAAEDKLKQLISYYMLGQQQPLLLNGNIAHFAFMKKRGKIFEVTQDKFEQYWHGSQTSLAFADDPYIQYFWPNCPSYEEIQPDLVQVYQDLYLLIVKKEIKLIKGTEKVMQ